MYIYIYIINNTTQRQQVLLINRCNTTNKCCSLSLSLSPRGAEKINYSLLKLRLGALSRPVFPCDAASELKMRDGSWEINPPRRSLEPLLPHRQHRIAQALKNTAINAGCRYELYCDPSSPLKLFKVFII